MKIYVVFMENFISITPKEGETIGISSIFIYKHLTRISWVWNNHRYDSVINETIYDGN